MSKNPRGATSMRSSAGAPGVEELRDRSGAPDLVVVDPPRAGLAGKALRRLGRIGAPRIVYGSGWYHEAAIEDGRRDIKS